MSGEIGNVGNKKEDKRIDKLKWRNAEINPPNGRFVLTKSLSSYMGCEYVYRTARKVVGYREGDWITEGNDRLTDFGLTPVAWAFLDHDE